MVADRVRQLVPEHDGESWSSWAKAIMPLGTKIVLPSVAAFGSSPTAGATA